jgi:hypothetical protein
MTTATRPRTRTRTRTEATTLRRALEDPITRAIVLYLVDLPPAARVRVLTFAIDAQAPAPGAIGRVVDTLRLHDGARSSAE